MFAGKRLHTRILLIPRIHVLDSGHAKPVRFLEKERGQLPRQIRSTPCRQKAIQPNLPALPPGGARVSSAAAPAAPTEGILRKDCIGPILPSAPSLTNPLPCASRTRSDWIDFARLRQFTASALRPCLFSSTALCLSTVIWVRKTTGSIQGTNKSLCYRE